MRRIASEILGLVIAIAGGGGSLLAEPPDESAGTTSEAAARLAASAAAVPQPNTYGTSVETALYVGGAAFSANRADVTVLEDGGGSAFFTGTGTPSSAWAPVSLPQGALITGVDFFYYDANATTDFTAAVYEFPSTTGTFNTVAVTASSGSAGLGSSTVNLGSPWTVNNNLNAYSVFVYYAPAALSNLKWRGVKIRYKLQVSPAPGTASFNDVPTGHQYFQFIEAVKASGITTGCQASPPLYCPDQPLTRGQMAVFLARALGLQWN